MPTQSTRAASDIQVVIDPPTDRVSVEKSSLGELEAEIWCEFDCIAYVFVGDDAQELTDRVALARSGEHSWDYVRPLSREELYNLD